MIAVPTAAGSATSFAQATVIRVVNVSGSSGTIGVCTVVGAATTNFITIPTGTVEYVEEVNRCLLWHWNYKKLQK